eukprot:655548-Amphidinium_carterae.1
MCADCAVERNCMLCEHMQGLQHASLSSAAKRRAEAPCNRDSRCPSPLTNFPNPTRCIPKLKYYSFQDKGP